MQILGVSGDRVSGTTPAHRHPLSRFCLSFVLMWPLLAVFPSDGAQGEPTVPPGQAANPDLLAASGTMRLGNSYVGMLAVDENVRTTDYARLSNFGYNLVRIWCTWSGPMHDGTRGSLVTATGEIRGGAGGTLATRFRNLLLTADDRNWVIDVTFDVDEFKAVGGTTYAQYKNAITTVANLVRTVETETLKDFRDNVIFDVVNEGINPTKDPDQNTFLQLRKLGGTPSSWRNALTQLLDVPRSGSRIYRAFFSMKAVGDADDKITPPATESPDQLYVELAAKYYNTVYAAYAGLEKPPFLAPHFQRAPCPHGWAERLATRVGYMRQWNGRALEPFETYLQEENRRGSSCCVNKSPCPSLDPLTPMEPLVTGCGSGGWPSGCAKSCDALSDDFKVSCQAAKGKRVYAWVFHSLAGMGCDDPDKRIEDEMDIEEVKVYKNAKSWISQ